MADREKVIAWLADTELFYREHDDSHNSKMACDALELLKEQENEITRISNEYLNLVKVASKQPKVVRCKDCKHFDGLNCKVNDIVNIMDVNWFCADGEKR